MIEYRVDTDDLFKSGAEALVNPVNQKGVMGKGLAKAFKAKFPVYFENYRAKCARHAICRWTPDFYRVGKHDGDHGNLKYIVSFATKYHWRDKSVIEDIQKGLFRLSLQIIRYRIESIAIPPLGCGLGGLDWDEVRPAFVRALESVSDTGTRVIVYEPWEKSERRMLDNEIVSYLAEQPERGNSDGGRI
ncbi:MAG: macro domain-containing protein [Gammaproteobacteria bacterium AqS3]|nr:macro domain-containing protein [Gammaproteobacteria bacterium AqS3]